jgi:hypothetical protein
VPQAPSELPSTLGLVPTALDTLRGAYHDNLCSTIIGQRRNRDGSLKFVDGTAVYKFADGDDTGSVLLADGITRRLDRTLCATPPGPQTAGTLFTTHTRTFLADALALLEHLLPGAIFIETRPSLAVIARFDQYEHLDELDRIAGENPEIAAVLGKDYVITPDIVVGRHPFSDDEINTSALLVGNTPAARNTPLRSLNDGRPTLKASVSCKWTMRSDRAQNIRTEAHNLIRNRKGPTPQIVAVTMEPLPARLESIALGLGDVDCVYHAALDELIDASGDLDGYYAPDLARLVNSRRFRDITDLPLDLVR